GLAELGDPTRATDLARVADRIGLSPGRAQRVVAELLGESPKRFDLRVRLDQAAVLLVATDARVIDIAMACGFENHETLTRAFGRRFDEAPIEWRRRHRSRVGSRLDPSQPPLVRTVSPCVTLYRRPLDQPPSGKDRPMTYDISTRTVEAVPILYQSRRVDRDAIAEALAEVLPAVFTYVMEQGLPMAGPPIVRIAETSPAFLTLEGGIPLAEAPADEPTADTGIQAGWLHAGTVATTIHVGPYDTLGDAHVAIERWIEARGSKAAGAPWEVYLTDPGEVPDPADWQTEVLWPLEP
ncbi:MAG: helix-turn-helix domain-containing protein, partial [Actinomycetota bacterium]